MLRDLHIDNVLLLGQEPEPCTLLSIPVSASSSLTLFILSLPSGLFRPDPAASHHRDLSTCCSLSLKDYSLHAFCMLSIFQVTNHKAFTAQAKLFCSS